VGQHYAGGLCRPYFASVTAVEQLLGMGLRLIGVLKTETRDYLISTLSVLPLEERG